MEESIHVKFDETNSHSTRNVSNDPKGLEVGIQSLISIKIKKLLQMWMKLKFKILALSQPFNDIQDL